MKAPIQNCEDSQWFKIADVKVAMNLRLRDAEKVVLLGESKVGKTSIIHRQIHGSSPSDHTATIGCLSHPIDIQRHNNSIRLHVWDTAGQELYRSLVPIYIRDAAVVFIVFDITDLSSFTSLDGWFAMVKEFLPAETPVVLVANKTDLQATAAVTDGAIDAFATDHNAQCFWTTTLTGASVQDLFEHAADLTHREAVSNYVQQKPTYSKATGRSCC
jgi:small GTP-binding protein